MAEDVELAQYKGNLTGSMTLLRELQHALYEIARQAELGSDDSLDKVQLRSEQALRLVDSCIISSQVEVGQMQLKLSPYGVGSIMHDAAHDLRLSTGLKVGVHAGVNQPVMTNAEMLKNLLYSAGNFIYDSVQTPVQIRSFANRNGDIGVGVFAKNFTLSPKDLRRALIMSEATYMPLSQFSQRSGIMILLADSIARALGSELQVKRLGKQKGFAAILPKSNQLSLVSG